MTKPFVAPTPWSPDRPHTLVVCCSDGRWHAQVVEFIQHEVSKYADLYAIPGGPAVLDPWNSSYDESRAFQESMRLLAKYHDLESVWLVAHEGCAFYLEKHPHLDADARHARQVEDLARGRASLLERYPNLHVRLIYAARHGESAIFEHCSDPVEKGRR
jgi:carbonic anhydrase-like protein